MKRKKRSFAASTPAVSPTVRSLSRRDEEMIFPSYRGLSRQIRPALGQSNDWFFRSASLGGPTLFLRSGITFGVV
jgi:hypothetical protein